MTTLMRASNEWSRRAPDERFGSLQDMHNKAMDYATNAAGTTVKVRDLHASVLDGEVILNGSEERTANLTNWAFGQLATKAEAPASYLRTLPAVLAADCLNNGLARAAVGDDAKLLFKREADDTLTARAITSDRYARIWNADITARLLEMEKIGPWQPAPAAFDGARGLYLSDRDMFAFMVDNDRRIFEKGPGGGLSRGFFAWNSEVGAASFGIMTFLYEWVCGNHRVWGAREVKEVRLRHVGSANDKAFSTMALELKEYADSSATEDEAKIERMRTIEIGANKDEVLDALFKLRIPALTKKTAALSYAKAEEHADWYGSPRTVWGIAGGMTEVARDLPNADERVALDRAAARVMEVAF